ncbi:hypothetical protein [Amycolatopsis jejuensis]|uniref:hypothetical protein n=1 Tax=Amycolatopsis jejuensis TaxID=330084 RepID=UPI0005254B99|nr:hypothetical protein [Amycolatopsis jejuensis]
MLVRKIPTWKRTRRALTVTTLAALVTGGTFLGTGTASAATTLANTCTGSVSGGMGDTVAVPGSSVKEMVRQAAQEQVNLFNFLTVQPNRLADAITAKPPLTVGKIPSSAGGNIGGDLIGAVVADNLRDAPGLGLLPDTQQHVLSAIRNEVTSSCGLTTLANNYEAPSSPSSSSPTSGETPSSTAPTSGSPLGNYQPGTTGTAPPRDYSGIPMASPGTPGTAIAPGIRYPAGGALPGSGTLPQVSGPDPQGAGPDIRNAGNAEALASRGSTTDVQLPMLLAVIVLAGVTAGLVRTWVLRRAA